MKKILIFLLISTCTTALYSADQKAEAGPSSSSPTTTPNEAPREEIPAPKGKGKRKTIIIDDPVALMLGTLKNSGIMTGSASTINYLEELIDNFSPEQIQLLTKTLLELCQSDQVLTMDIIKRALKIMRLHIQVQPGGITPEALSPSSTQNQSTTIENIKLFGTTLCASAVGYLLVRKAIQLYSTNKQ